MRPDHRRRLEAAIAAARRQLAALREREEAELHAEAASGDEAGRVPLLPRIRALVAEVVRPLVQHRQHLLDEVGGLWVGEEVWRRGHLPRVFIEYRSRLIAPEAPTATLILGFHPDDEIVITWIFKSPLRNTATRVRRFADLSSETVAQEIDAFLAAAVLGHVGSDE